MRHRIVARDMDAVGVGALDEMVPQWYHRHGVHASLTNPNHPLRFYKHNKWKTHPLHSNIFFLSSENPPHGFLLGEVFVGALPSLFSGSTLFVQRKIL